MAGERWRLFVATALPGAAAAALWQSLARLRDRHPQARWLPPEQYHVTLVFLGSTDPARLAEIRRVIGEVAVSNARFAASTGSGGGRPDNRRGGVAWVRLAGGRHQLASIALALDRALGTRQYERQRPLPHVTVARRVTGGLIADLRAASTSFGVEWPVERISLFRSHTGPRGSVYEELAAAYLAG